MPQTFLYSTSPSPFEDRILQAADARRTDRTRPLRAVALRTAMPDPTDDDLLRLREHFCNRPIPVRLDDAGLNHRSDAFDPAVIDRVRTADLVIIGGGDPRRLRDLTVGTPALGALQSNHRTGAVVAGCSAGAAVLGAGMLLGSSGDIDDNSARTPLWGWFPDLVIAPHFGRYDHAGWLAAFSDCALLGIPDDAMAMITDDTVEALGEQPLTIVEASREIILAGGERRTLRRAQELRSDE